MGEDVLFDFELSAGTSASAREHTADVIPRDRLDEEAIIRAELSRIR
jgi:hypothetical protein